MKIVGYSNFDIETVNDFIVCENVNKVFGPTMLKALTDMVTDNSTYYYKLVPDDYKLHKWEP